MKKDPFILYKPKKYESKVVYLNQKELDKLILNNIDAARKLVDNYGNTIRAVRRSFRDSLIEKLKEKLGENYLRRNTIP